jgi:hypothetical protein
VVLELVALAVSVASALAFLLVVVLVVVFAVYSGGNGGGGGNFGHKGGVDSGDIGFVGCVGVGGGRDEGDRVNSSCGAMALAMSGTISKMAVAMVAVMTAVGMVRMMMAAVVSCEIGTQDVYTVYKVLSFTTMCAYMCHLFCWAS